MDFSLNILRQVNSVPHFLLFTMFSPIFSCGVLSAYTAGPLLSSKTLALWMAAPPLMLLVALLWLPETPAFLISVGRMQVTLIEISIFLTNTYLYT